MNRAALLTGISVAALFLIAGCGYRTDTFEIQVRNATQSPLTLSLAKDGPPYETVWATPDDISVESPKLRENREGNPNGTEPSLAPGKKALLKVTGQFAGGTRGYVRVYEGALTISQMCAIHAGAFNRVDVPLHPGENRIVVTRHDSQLVANPE